MRILKELFREHVAQSLQRALTPTPHIDAARYAISCEMVPDGPCWEVYRRAFLAYLDGRRVGFAPDMVGGLLVDGRPA